jgi:hypothetical protein
VGLGTNCAPLCPGIVELLVIDSEVLTGVPQMLTKLGIRTLPRLRSKSFWLRVAPAILATIAGIYALLAYLVVPSIWKHYRLQHQLDGMVMMTQTAHGIAGDPINVGLVGTQAEILCAMRAARWYPADPITLKTSLKIVGSVMLRRPYPAAPVSPLIYLDRRQDLAFQHPEGGSARRRNHVRFWAALEHGDEDRPVWLGAATFDESVGLSRYTGAVTHHIAANIDAARNALANDLDRARKIDAVYQVSGIGPAMAKAIPTSRTATYGSRAWRETARPAPTAPQGSRIRPS